MKTLPAPKNTANQESRYKNVALSSKQSQTARRTTEQGNVGAIIRKLSLISFGTWNFWSPRTRENEIWANLIFQ